jgi:hypothetical protein
MYRSSRVVTTSALQDLIDRIGDEPIACSPELPARNNLAQPFGAHIEPLTYRRYRCSAKRTSTFHNNRWAPDPHVSYWGVAHNQMSASGGNSRRRFDGRECPCFR